MKMVQATSVFAPNALVIPLSDTGAPTFKLEAVARANGFREHNAHDALGDVEATIHLCKLIRERALGLWTTFIRFNRKLSVQDLLRRGPVVCLTEFYGGPYSWLVTAIGRNPENDNEICVLDLAENPEGLSGMSDDELVPSYGSTIRAGAGVCPSLDSRSSRVANSSESNRANRRLAESGKRAVKAISEEIQGISRSAT